VPLRASRSPPYRHIASTAPTASFARSAYSMNLKSC
jgi:hypothetical protein